MTDLRKAAEMALKALENNQPVNYCQNNNGERFPMFKEDPFRFDCNTKAIEALRQALAQTEPAIGDIRALKHRIHELEGELIGYKRLLDAQPEQEPVAWISADTLKLDHIIKATIQVCRREPDEYYNVPLYTAPVSKPDDLLRQSEQEGWRWAKECEAEVKRLRTLLAEGGQGCGECGVTVSEGYALYCVKCVEPMFKKEWVSLTDEERRDIREWRRIQEELGPVWAPMMLYLYEAIEAKLKEKNT